MPSPPRKTRSPAGAVFLFLDPGRWHRCVRLFPSLTSRMTCPGSPDIHMIASAPGEMLGCLRGYRLAQLAAGFIQCYLLGLLTELRTLDIPNVARYMSRSLALATGVVKSSPEHGCRVPSRLTLYVSLPQSNACRPASTLCEGWAGGCECICGASPSPQMAVLLRPRYVYTPSPPQAP